MRYLKIIANIILIGLCAWWIANIPNRKADYAAPLIFLITLTGTLINEVSKIFSNKRFVKHVKDFGKDLRGFDYKTRPAS